NRAADVLPELETATGRDPFNTALKLLLAREYRRARQPANAERIYRKLLAETPTPDVFRGLCDIYKEQRPLGGDRALQQLAEAVAAATRKSDKPGDGGADLPADSSAAANARAMLQVLRDDPEAIRLLLHASHRALQGGRRLNYQTRALLATLAARTRQLDTAE